MTSRRPMTRSYSGNGRTSSFSEEETSSSNGRSESRNTYLSNVRPENSYSRYSHYRPTRSTLCSVMAQLTEDVQPSFETTLKSKAVSENCNVKFTCVVSGYPAPELKWYKDDMEMDRYCGLPKYEIRRNGKTHTLHIYNCTLDDAAIYQVSASNSKGIVSCSGVLEVGIMNEYKIHQRFFAKLKQKAEKKRSDLEMQAKQEGKENIQKEKPQSSPERPPRKRHIPPPEERPIMVKEPEAMEEPGAAAEPNGVSTEFRETAPVTPKDSDVSPSDKTLAKKKFKISNGVDVGVNNNPSSNSSSRSHMMGNGGENCYDGGFSLAQFLAETLQSQAAEEKQSSPRGEKPKEADTPVITASKEKEREQERVRKEREEQEKAQEEEYEREKRREEALAIEREKEREKLLSMSHTVANTKHGSEVKHQSKAHKDHDHHHIQVSITSMLHTVKDFLFGKSKKDCHDHVESKVQEFDHSPASTQPPKPDTPPSFRLQLGHNEVCRPLTEDIMPMEIDKREEPSDSVDTEQHSVSLELHEQKHEDSVPSADLPLAHKLPPESIQEPTGQSVKEADGAVEAMEVSAGPESRRAAKEMSLSGLQILTEDVSVIKEVPIQQQEPHCLVVSPQPSHQPAREKSSPWEDISVLPQTQTSYEEQSSPTSTLTSLEESWTPPNSDISAPDSLSLGEASTQTAINVDKMSKGEPGTEVSHSSIKIFEEEKAEVKSNKQPHSDIYRSEITVLKAFSLEERIEPCESKTPVQVLLPLSTVAANEKERDNVKEETVSVIQEMNVGFPPTATPESLEEGDLKIQHECTSSVGEESTQVHSLSAVQSPNSGFRSSEEKVELNDVLCSSLEKDLEVNLFNDLKTQDTAVLEGESTEALNESLQSVVETEKMDLIKAEEFDQSKNISVTQDKESNANVSEEGSYVAQQDSSESREREQGWPSENIPQIQISTAEDSQYIKPIQNKESNANFSEEGSYVAQRDSIESIESRERQQGWPSENIPQIKISTTDDTPDIKPTQNKEGNANVLKEHTNVAQQDRSESRERQQGWPSENTPQIQVSSIEDTSDIKPTLPDLNSNEHFETPKVKQMEPGLKECTLPLTILAQNKQELEPDTGAILQKHDATHVSAVIIQDQSTGDSQCLLPTQNGMQNDYNFSPTGKVKEIVKVDDKTEIFDREKPHTKSSEPLSQMDLASIPVINISPTDDKEKDVYVDTLVSDKPQLVETPTVPLFVVPPVSVTCHVSDSALRLSTQSESTETETIAATQRGTKHYVGNNVNTKPQKSQSRKQNLDEMAEKNIQENTPPVLYETVTPKVSDNGSSLSRTSEIPEILKTKFLKEAKIENSVSVDDLQTNRPYVDRLSSKPPTHPSLSPASLRKFMPRAAPDSDNEAVTTVPVITVGDRQSDKADEDLSGGSTPTSSLSCESSPRLKRRDSLSLIRSATPEELASGARRKIFIPKPKEDGEGVVVGAQDIQGKKETPYMSPSQARRAALLQAPTGQNTPPMERRSPLLSRRKITLEVPKVVEETPTEEPVSTKQEEKPAERKPDPLKAPQVIRKIRGEPFPDASGHLKLWCQFFNVLSDSTIKWYKDEEEILELKRSGGDESQVALAIVLASSQDCGVYGCSISNEYGTDTTDFLLSIDILSEILLRDDLEVGEEIEMTPLLFTRGLADTGSWGDKYFGRIMSETVHIGEGCAHKASQVKVIYGLDPIFESGSSGIIKVQNPIAYGTKQETSLAERNLEITKQECKVQNTIREYCKIFAAEARVIENFGQSLEVIPQYLMYRPANSVPYATVEVDLKGAFQMYCMMDPKGKLITKTGSEVEQKCSTFQHWIHQWTHGNLLVTRLEGVETKITNVRVVTKSKGYQGLTEFGSPEVFEQFLTHHQCNYYCGLLGLHPLKTLDSLQQPTKMKGSRSPLLNRKLGSSSPQLQRKGQSPQMFRKANSSPKVTRKVQETEDSKSGTKPKPAETDDVLEMR